MHRFVTSAPLFLWSCMQCPGMEASIKEHVLCPAGEVLTEMAEYVKGVGRIEDESSAQPKAESSYMGVDDMDEAPAQPSAELKQEASGAGKFGAWVSAEGDEANDAEDAGHGGCRRGGEG